MNKTQNEAEVEAVARALTDCPAEWDEHDERDKDVFRRMAVDGIAALDAVRSSGSAAQNHEERCNVPGCVRVFGHDGGCEYGSAAPNHEEGVARLANDLAGDWRERAERAEADVTMWKTRLVKETARLRELLLAARSPQDEDHEAGIEAVARNLMKQQVEIIEQMSEPKRSEYMADLLANVRGTLRGAGFLSRCSSPERDDLPPDDGSGYVTGTAYQRVVDHYEARLSSPERDTERLIEVLKAFAADKWGTSNPILVPDDDRELQQTYYKALAEFDSGRTASPDAG